ncbi:MAG: tetratricopeptide repeat protein [Gemmatimonadota bacterium]
MNESKTTIFQQLRNRKLFQVLLLYLGLAFGLAEVSEFVVDNYDLSRKVLDVTLFLLILGIPAAAVIAWYHGEKGQQRVQRGEAAILAVLVVIAAIGTYRIGTAEPAPARDLSAVVDLGNHSVAVMPFSSRLTDPELDWLSTGVSELLTTGLAGLSSIRVVSGQRLFDLLRQEGRENATEIPPDLATRLTRKAGARFMVDGSVLGSRNDLVMTADLVNVETGDVEASSRVRGADVFALVDSIAADLSAQIAGAPIEPTEMASVASFTTRDPEAYRQYLLGIQANRRFHRLEALERLQRAVELDSTFALAHIRLSGVAMDNQQISIGLEALDNARTYRDQAPERDRLYLDAILAEVVDGDEDEARRILTRLVGQYPDDKEARAALLRRYDSRSEERGRLLEETIRLDPLDGSAHNELAYFRAREGNFAAADSLIERYVELEPSEPNPLDSRGEILMIAGRHEEAREAFRAALALQPGFTFALDHLAESWAAERRFGEGITEIEQIIRESEPRAALVAYTALAILRTYEGELSSALEALETASRRAAELNVPSVRNSALVAQLPFLAAIQDWDRLNDRATALNTSDPLNPFPPLAALLGLGEQGRIEEAEVLGQQMRAALDTVPGLASFRPLLEAMLNREMSFYRGDFSTSAASAAETREQGGMPELGSFTEVRALLALGRYQEALDQARRTATFFGPGQVLIGKQRLYFMARAQEGLADTANAIGSYERLLTAKWTEAVREIPNLADAGQRLAALKAAE